MSPRVEQRKGREEGRVAVQRERRSKVRTEEAEVALASVVRLGDRFQKKADEFFRPLGLTAAQYNVLRILEGAGELLPQQEIAKRLLVSRANVTGLIDKLESAGYVERCPCGDRRVNMICLTGKGRDFVEKTFEALVGLASEELKPLSAEERKGLIRLISRLLEDEG